MSLEYITEEVRKPVDARVRDMTVDETLTINGALVFSGNLVIQNADPSIEINNDGNNSNAATLSLNGNTALGVNPLVILQGPAGNATITNTNLGSSTTLTGTGGPVNVLAPVLQFNTASVGQTNITQTKFLSGSWLPQLFVGGSSTGIVYLNQSGNYIQLGDVVWMNGSMVVNSIGGLTGQLTVSLPLPAGSNIGLIGNNLAPSFSAVTFPSGYTDVFMQVAPSTSLMNIVFNTTNPALPGVYATDAAFNVGFMLTFSGIFFTTTS